MFVDVFPLCRNVDESRDMLYLRSLLWNILLTYGNVDFDFCFRMICEVWKLQTTFCSCEPPLESYECKIKFPDCMLYRGWIQVSILCARECHCCDHAFHIFHMSLLWSGLLWFSVASTQFRPFGLGVISLWHLPRGCFSTTPKHHSVGVLAAIAEQLSDRCGTTSWGSNDPRQFFVFEILCLFRQFLIGAGSWATRFCAIYQILFLFRQLGILAGNLLLWFSAVGVWPRSTGVGHLTTKL